MQKLNVRIVSFFLILAFSQKMGLELWLHNWLHETTVSASVGVSDPAGLAHKGKVLFQQQRVKCTCIDDALMPLLESEVVDYSPFQPSFTDIYPTTYSSWLSVNTEFSSLRGPPAAAFSI